MFFYLKNGYTAKAHSEPCQIAKVEYLAKLVNG